MNGPEGGGGPSCGPNLKKGGGVRCGSGKGVFTAAHT